MKKLMFCAVFGLLSFVSVVTKATTDEGFKSTAFAVQCSYLVDGAWTPILPANIAAACPGTGDFCGFCFDTTAPAAYDTEAEARAVYLANNRQTPEGQSIIINGVDTKIVPYYRTPQ